MVPHIGAAIGALLAGGGGFYFFIRAGDAVDAISTNLLEYVNNKVWPNMLPTFRILPALLLIVIISYCDAFLRAEPRTTSESLLVNSLYYTCWMCALYFILKVLVDDILKVKTETDGLIVIVVLILGVLLPLLEALGSNLVQMFNNIVYFVIIVIVLLLAIKKCTVPK